MVAETLARALAASPAELHERMLIAQRAVHRNDSRKWLSSMRVDHVQRLANVL
jgi:trehalose-6-phosphate synthase